MIPYGLSSKHTDLSIHYRLNELLRQTYLAEARRPRSRDPAPPSTWPLAIAKRWTVWPWRNASLLAANMSIAHTYSLQLKAGKGLANVPIFRRYGWPSLAEGEGGACTPIGMPTNGYHGDTDEMLRRQPPACCVQTSCIEMSVMSAPHSIALLYDHLQPSNWNCHSNMIPLILFPTSGTPTI